MSGNRTKGRRPNRHDRAFSPTPDGRLESRCLLSLLSHSKPPGELQPLHLQVGYGGQTLQVTTKAGDIFDISITGNGTVRGHWLPGHKELALTVQGTTGLSILDINPVNHPKTKGTAHQFSYKMTAQDHVLPIGSINVTSGTIFQINGYHTADLYGPITVGGTAPVDRIALNSIQPGGSIVTGGDLNSLDILNGVTLDGSAGSNGIGIGRDLNEMSVGGNMLITNGAQFNVLRDVGLFAQVAKGTGPPGQGISVLGNLTVTPGSLFRIGRSLDGVIIVYGMINGLSNFSIPNPTSTNFIAVGGYTP